VTPHARRVGLVLAGLALAGCGRPVHPVRADAASVRARTVPPGGRLGAVTPYAHGPQSAQASWSVETEMSWSDYGPWVEEQLPEFRVIERQDGRIRLSRHLEGDLYVLELVAGTGSDGLTVDASFMATPF